MVTGNRVQGMMKDKRGTVLHWIIFVILGMLAWFFILNAKVETTGLAGEWQLSFLQENYFPAQQDELRFSLKARQETRETATMMAQQGGFLNAAECGKYAGVALWNKRAEYCFPDAEKIAEKEVQERLKRQGYELQSLDIQDDALMGMGIKRKVVSKAGEYTYIPQFQTKLGYSFGEYLTLSQQALDLLAACRQEFDLDNCVEIKRGVWRDCSSAVLQSQGLQSQGLQLSGRERIFCIASAAEGFDYRVALDFTNTEPFAIKDVGIRSTAERIEISFPLQEKEGAQHYTIYITDYTLLETKTGKAQELEQDVPTGLNYFWDMIELREADFVDNLQACTQEEARGAGVPYRCESNMVYVLNRRALPSTRDQFLVAVTLVEEGKESAIERWGKVE